MALHRNEKIIPYSSVIAIQFKTPGIITYGVIQLTLKGDPTDIVSSLGRPNTVSFSKKQTKNFEEAKRLIEGKIIN